MSADVIEHIIPTLINESQLTSHDLTSGPPYWKGSHEFKSLFLNEGTMFNSNHKLRQSRILTFSIENRQICQLEIKRVANLPNQTLVDTTIATYTSRLAEATVMFKKPVSKERK